MQYRLREAEETHVEGPSPSAEAEGEAAETGTRRGSETRGIEEEEDVTSTRLGSQVHGEDHGGLQRPRLRLRHHPREGKTHVRFLR